MSTDAAYTKHQHVLSGDHLFKEGDAGDTAYVIRSGMLEVYQDFDGERIVLGVIGPGEIVGEMALLDDSPRMASVIARESTILLVIERDIFRKKIDATDKTTRHLLQKFISIIREQATAIGHQTVLLRKSGKEF
jgi:CRP/FNR family cyclic AMP-dependent transcriptional regulator